MTSFKQKLLAVGVVLGTLGLQISLIIASSSANATQDISPQHEEPVASVSLSWVDAQKAKYQIDAPGLNTEQENKLITMMRLMTLDL